MKIQPSFQHVEVDCGTTFTTDVEGIGKECFTYQWKHGGRVIVGANGDTLNIKNVSESSSGVYECIVSNTYGDTGMATAELSKSIF